MKNSVFLIGRLGKDPEIKTLSNGNKVANMTLATSESYRNKAGEKVENTEWHNIVVWNQNLVTIVEKYIEKGSLLFVEGKLKTRNWEDKNGQKHYQTEVVIENFGGEIKILSPKQGGNQEIRPSKPGGREPDGLPTDIPETSLPEDDDSDLPF